MGSEPPAPPALQRWLKFSLKRRQSTEASSGGGVFDARGVQVVLHIPIGNASRQGDTWTHAVSHADLLAVGFVQAQTATRFDLAMAK